MGQKLAAEFAAQIYNQYAVNDDDTFECQLWELFDVFASQIGMGIDVPFVDNVIEF